MCDDTFGHDFIWYEWSFIAPDELPREDLEVTGDTCEQSRILQSPYVRVQEPSDVWPKHA